MRQVMKAEPYRFGAMGSLGNASHMIIRQYNFPLEYGEKDVMLYADHDRCLQWDHDHAMSCFKRHTGTGDCGLERWARAATDQEVFLFLRELLKADENHKGVKWTGYRITGTVHLGNGYPVWSLELYAKHPETNLYAIPTSDKWAELEWARLESEKKAAIAERDALRKDVADAAGELMVTIPEPGTVLSKLLIANSIMRRQREEALDERDALRRAVDWLAHNAPGTPVPEWLDDVVNATPGTATPDAGEARP